MFEHILIPTDGSDAARSAAETAIELAVDQGATVHVLSVVKPIHSDEGGVEQAIESMRTARERTVAELVELADAEGLVTTSDVAVGIPVRKILEYIETNDIDLVVMGTHGRTGVSRFLIGSVTEKVVRLSEIPVLTIYTGSKGKK